MAPGIQEVVMKCPFCKEGDIKVIHSPSSVRFKKGTYGGGRPGVIRSSEHTEVKNSCSFCGKGIKDLKRAIDSGIVKELSHEERLKRLQASGLPMKIVSKRER